MKRIAAILLIVGLCLTILLKMTINLWFQPTSSFWHPSLWSPQVKQGTIGALATVFSPAVVAFLAFKLVQKFQFLEGRARTELSLDVRLKARCIDSPTNAQSTSKQTILETQLEITNNSRRACCIPAAYVSARPLNVVSFGPLEYQLLPLCGSLSDIKNLAHIKHSVIQLAPDETEQFVRWDLLEQPLLEKAAMIVVSVEVFAAEFDHLGQAHYPPREGPFFRDWVEYMESENAIRDKYIVFDRWNPKHSGRDHFKPFDRYLKTPQAGPDFDNSKKFARVLSTVVQWNRCTIVSTRP